MKKISAILISILPVILITVLSWFIYRSIPTTPVLLLIILALFFSIMLSIGLYKKILVQNDMAQSYSEDDFPAIEDSLIYVSPIDFCEKIEHNEGDLFIVGSSFGTLKTKLINAEYKKLTDTTVLYFDNKLNVEIDDLTNIGVGDVQFCFYGFSEMRLSGKSIVNHKYNWNDSNLTLTKQSDTKELFTPDRFPVLIFTWGEVF